MTDSQMSFFDPDHTKNRIMLDGHKVEVTDVFWRYWYLAAERQQIFMRRINSETATVDIGCNTDVISVHKCLPCL